jgi:hypothetical protein
LPDRAGNAIPQEYKMKHLKGPFGQSATMSSDFLNIRSIRADLGEANTGVDRGYKEIAQVRYVEGLSQADNLAIADLLCAAPELRDMLANLVLKVKQVTIAQQAGSSVSVATLAGLTKATEEADALLTKVKKLGASTNTSVGLLLQLNELQGDEYTL